MKPPSALIATIKVWIIPIILMALVYVGSITINKNVNRPEYAEQAEFSKLLEKVKDKPFTITIDGKVHEVVVKEKSND